MDRILKILFFALIVRPIVLVVLGLNLRGKAKLPDDGPAIIAANHNSHLDSLVLMSLFPLRKIHKVRPVAAADYFLKTPWRAWFSRTCIGIVAIDRNVTKNTSDLFTPPHDALDNGDILIVFPEGSRGNPEEMSSIKKGIYRVIEKRNDTQITPVMMHGLGRSLPRGEAILVPFNCDVIVGDCLPSLNNSREFVDKMAEIFADLQKYCITKNQD